MQAWAYTVETGHKYYPPTQKLPGTNLATPESFIPIDLTVQKLTNIFQNMESH